MKNSFFDAKSFNKYSIQNSKRNSIKIVKHDIYHHKKMNNLNNKKRCWKILSPVIV